MRPPLFWGLASAALLLGLIGGLGAGRVQSAATSALVIVAVLLSLAVSSRHLRVEASIVGGSGYVVPKSKRVQWLHVALLVLFNIGIIVIVLAAVVRAGLVAIDFTNDTVAWAPLAMGIYLVLLMIAARWRFHEQGGYVHDWSVRAHGWVVIATSIPVFLIGALLLAFGDLRARGVSIVTQADLVVLALVIVLGAGTQVFLAARLPSAMDLGVLFAKILKADGQESGTPPIVYAAMIAVGGSAVIGFVLSQFDVVGALGGFRNERVALLLILIPVGLALFFLTAVLQIYREGRRGLYAKKLSPKLRTALLVYGFSGMGGVFFGGLMILVLTGRVDHVFGFAAGPTLAKDLVMLTIVVSVGPVGWYLQRENLRIDHIENRLPDFLNDLAENRRAGLTLAAALQATALSDYGALTKEIQKMANQVAWGVSFSEALGQFAARVPTSLVRRSAFLIIEAQKTGGSVTEILKAAARDAYELKSQEAQRRVTMTTYLIVIYVVFFVFMTVIAVLDTQFIPQVLEANEAVEEIGQEGFGAGSNLDRDQLQFIYFNASIVQALGNGMVGGVLSEGRITAGFRHVAFMAFMAWVLFRLVLGA